MLLGATGIHTSLLPKVREMAPFGRWEPVLSAPKGLWTLSTCQKSSYKPGWAHFWRFALSLGGKLLHGRQNWSLSWSIFFLSWIDLCFLFCCHFIFERGSHAAQGCLDLSVLLSLQSWGSQRATKPSLWQVPNEWVTSLMAAGCLRVTLLDSPSLCQSQFLYLLRIFSSK